MRTCGISFYPVFQSNASEAVLGFWRIASVHLYGIWYCQMLSNKEDLKAFVRMGGSCEGVGGETGSWVHLAYFLVKYV